MPQRLRSKARTIAPLLLLLAATTISCDSRKEQPKLAAYLPPETSAVLQVDSSLVDLLEWLPPSSLFFRSAGNTPFESLTFLLLGQSDSGSVATLTYDPKSRLDIKRLAVGPRVASDDDSGPGVNAHLKWRVPEGEAGLYWVHLSQYSDATAHEMIIFDDDGAGGLDSKLYWGVQKGGTYWIQLEAVDEEQMIEGEIYGVVGSDSLKAELEGVSDDFWGPFSLMPGEEISVETSTTSGDPKLSLTYLLPDTGTLSGVIGDSTFIASDLDYSPWHDGFGPFYLDEGDVVDLTTNTIFDAFLELNADPNITKGYLDIYPLGMGWSGAQPSKAVTISADGSFDLSSYNPLSESSFEHDPLLGELIGLIDWDSPFAGAFILSDNFRARQDYIASRLLSDAEREMLRERVQGIAMQGYRVGDMLHLDIILRVNESEDDIVTVKALWEDLLYRGQQDLNIPLSIRLLLRPPYVIVEQIDDETVQLSVALSLKTIRQMGALVTEVL